jgi:hypothetical protein
MDHIREFLSDCEEGSDGFLPLKSKIVLKGTSVYLEPWVQPDVADRYIAPWRKVIAQAKSPGSILCGRVGATTSYSCDPENSDPCLFYR